MNADALTHKVGPLPVWAWCGAVGLGGYLAYRRHAASATAAPGTVTASTDGADVAGTAGNLSAGGGGGAGDGTGYTAPAAIVDNQSWQLAAENSMFLKGYDPAQLSSALTAYLEGDPLTTAQQAMVSAALLAAGPAPQYVPPITNAPTTSTPAPGGTDGTVQVRTQTGQSQFYGPDGFIHTTTTYSDGTTSDFNTGVPNTPAAAPLAPAAPPAPAPAPAAAAAQKAKDTAAAAAAAAKAAKGIGLRAG